MVTSMAPAATSINHPVSKKASTEAFLLTFLNAVPRFSRHSRDSFDGMD